MLCQKRNGDSRNFVTVETTIITHCVVGSFTYQYPQWQYCISGVNWQAFNVGRIGILEKEYKKPYNVLET